MSYSILKKTLVIFVLFLFVCGAVFPGFSVGSKEIETQEPLNDKDEKVVTCYILDKKGKSQQEVILSPDDYERFYSKFEELNQQVIYSPFSSETKVLKADFAGLIDSLGLIPEGSSKDDVISLMNPSIGIHRPLFSLLPTPVYNGRGSAFFCNFATWGEGSQFPVIILPRLIPILLIPIPRVIMRWNAVYGITSCGGLLSGKGFIAEGAQKGTALGFWGIGFSVFLPPVMSFGFIGYALFATASAEIIHPWPPNRPPVVSGEIPSDGSVDVPLSLSELSFQISDEDGDCMNYSVTTNPDIGGGSGNNVVDGTYTVPVSGLDSNTEYSWQVVLSDGEDTTQETFSFHTEIEPPFVSDPLPFDGDDWVSVDLSQLSFKLEDFQGDPMDYTVETVPDIGSGSGSGVGNGVYSVPVDSLDYTTDYTWFVNVTDGKFWTRKVFDFKTQPMMVFDPFDEGWSYRKQITINHSQVAGDLVDFPVLISLTDVDLRDKAQVDGDDVLFLDGEGVASRLFHEIEFFNGSSGELISWVNVSGLSSGVDTVLYLYYGNSGCGNQEYPDKVWDSGYCGIWHLNDFDDSTNNKNDGTNYGTDDCPGKIGNAKDFVDTSYDFISLGDMTEPADGSNSIATFEAWINPKNMGKTRPIICKLDTTFEPDKRAYKLEILGTGQIRFSAQSGTYHPDDRIIRFTTNDNLVTTDTWHQIVTVIDLSEIENTAIYYNGEEQAYEVKLLGNPPSHFYDIDLEERFGYLAQESGSVYYDGSMDELRISKLYRNNEWILTQFFNQNDILNFLRFGPEET